MEGDEVDLSGIRFVLWYMALLATIAVVATFIQSGGPF